MKRSKLVRKTPLHSKHWLVTRHDFGTKVYSAKPAALRKRGRRAAREAEQATAFRDVVLSRGRCERCEWSPLDDVRGSSMQAIIDAARAMGARVLELSGSHGRLEAHHITPRSRASAAWKHDPVRNGACLCARCHQAVHDHTALDWRKWLRTSTEHSS